MVKTKTSTIIILIAIIAAIFYFGKGGFLGATSGSIITTSESVIKIGNTIQATIDIQNTGMLTENFLIEMEVINQQQSLQSIVGIQHICDTNNPCNVHRDISIGDLGPGDTAHIVLTSPALANGNYKVKLVSVDSCCNTNPNCQSWSPYEWGKDINTFIISGSISTQNCLGGTAWCGDGFCNGQETPSSCPEDCQPSCTPHTSSKCYNGDVYWYNSCDIKEELKQDCSQDCSDGQCTECTPSCSGKSCGADNGCGNQCQSGSCPSGQECQSGNCVSSPISSFEIYNLYALTNLNPSSPPAIEFSIKNTGTTTQGTYVEAMYVAASSTWYNQFLTIVGGNIINNGLFSLYGREGINPATSCQGESFVEAASIDPLASGEEKTFILRPKIPTQDSKWSDQISNYNSNGQYLLFVGAYPACGQSHSAAIGQKVLIKTSNTIGTEICDNNLDDDQNGEIDGDDLACGDGDCAAKCGLSCSATTCNVLTDSLGNKCLWEDVVRRGCFSDLHPTTKCPTYEYALDYLTESSMEDYGCEFSRNDYECRNYVGCSGNCIKWDNLPGEIQNIVDIGLLGMHGSSGYCFTGIDSSQLTAKKQSVSIEKFKQMTIEDTLLVTCTSSSECQSDNCVSYTSLVENGIIESEEKAESMISQIDAKLAYMMGGSLAAGSTALIWCVNSGRIAASSAKVPGATTISLGVAAVGCAPLVTQAVIGGAMGGYLLDKTVDSIKSRETDKVGVCLEKGAIVSICSTDSFAYDIGNSIYSKGTCSSKTAVGWLAVAMGVLIFVSFLGGMKK